jgi:hypothetical protein
MAWSVRIQDEFGKVFADDFVVEFGEIPCGSQYPTCAAIARYYDTWLNPPQLKAFMAEWDAAILTEEFSTLRDKRTLRDAAEKAERKQLYLRFIAD